MKLKIAVSEKMNKYKSPLGSIEDRLLRMPDKLRKKLGFKPGLFLSLKGKYGTLSLQVTIAYQSDALLNSEVAYVSSDTFKLLSSNKIESFKPAKDITLGCDPEFHLVDSATGFNVSAGHFFSYYGELGNDCGLAELRPRPSTDPAFVVNDIRRLLIQAQIRLLNRGLMKKSKILMIGASHFNNMSAGFHIHFGLPKPLLTANNVKVLENLVSVMDYYIGISAILPEGDKDFIRRSERFSHYGKPGDYRWDRMTLEYRVPGGHLLRHPVLSHGILSISKVVMKDLLSRLGKLSNDFNDVIDLSYGELQLLYPNLPAKSLVREAIVSENINIATNYIKTIVSDISKMVGYEEEKIPILKYYKYVVNNMLGKEVYEAGLEHNWRLANEIQQRQMAVH